jgi:hypothetical protein
MREKTAERMGITLKTANERLSRRDVSYVVNLFLSRKAREMQGEVEWRITSDALAGGVRDKEMYMRNIAQAGEDDTSPALEIPAEAMGEAELMRTIANLRKSVDEPVDTIPAEVEIKDAEFEAS